MTEPDNGWILLCSTSAWRSVAELMEVPDRHDYCVLWFWSWSINVSLQLDVAVGSDGKLLTQAIAMLESRQPGVRVEVVLELWRNDEQLGMAVLDKQCRGRRTLGSAALDLWEAAADISVPPAAAATPWDPSRGAWLRVALRVWCSPTSCVLYEGTQATRDHSRLCNPHTLRNVSAMRAAVARMRARTAALVQRGPAVTGQSAGTFVAVRSKEAAEAADTLWVCRDEAERLGLVGLVAHMDAIRNAAGTGIGGVPSVVLVDSPLLLRRLEDLLLASALRDTRNEPFGRIGGCTGRMARTVRLPGQPRDAHLIGLIGHVTDLPELLEAALIYASPEAPVRRALMHALRVSPTFRAPAVEVQLCHTFMDRGTDEERNQALATLQRRVDAILQRLTLRTGHHRSSGSSGADSGGLERQALGLLMQLDPQLRTWGILARHAGLFVPDDAAEWAVSEDEYVAAGTWLQDKASRKRSRSDGGGTGGRDWRTVWSDVWRQADKPCAQAKAMSLAVGRVRGWLTAARVYGLLS